MSSPTPRFALPLQSFVTLAAAVLALCLAVAPTAEAQAPASPPAKEKKADGKAKQEPVPAPGSQTFNTVMTKLKAGKQIFSNTITEPDLEAAKKACEGQDFIWIEMQHATLTWRETANLIEVIAAA